MNQNFTNSFILKALDLPIIYNLDSLSNSVGISKPMLYLLSLENKKFYNNFYISKKNGTKREINSPNYSLKLVQRWILAEILEKINVSDESMAFRKGFNGSKENAEHHKFSLYILQLDIKDFFPSITRERVYNLFKSLGYNSLVSNILTNLCTYNNHLPQGGVCSPYLSNLICNKLDKRLKGLSSKRDVIYTRYADDLSFSCDNVAILRKLKNIIEEIIIDEGFVVNTSKTRLLSPSAHKLVTGITVNDRRIKASKELKKNVRSMIHNAIVTGDYSKNKVIIGYIAYINSIEENYIEKIKNYITELMKKDYKYYRESVDAYNNNKLFKDLEMVYVDPYQEFDELYQEYPLAHRDFDTIHMPYGERENFLKKRGYLAEVKDDALDETASTELEDEYDF